MAEAQGKLHFAILEYLARLAPTLDAAKVESLEVAQQCLTDVFGLSTSSPADVAQYSIGPLTLDTTFQAGLTLVCRALCHLFVFHAGCRAVRAAPPNVPRPSFGFVAVCGAGSAERCTLRIDPDVMGVVGKLE